MKEINVIYENGFIKSADDINGHYDQEDKALKINATIQVDGGRKVRAYIKSANNNSTIIMDENKITAVEGVYSVIVDGEYMVKGTLYVGFEIYDEGGYAERTQPLKIYIDAFVGLGAGSGGNVYVVTVDVGDVYSLDPYQDPIVENVGTKKDMILNFGIPRGQRITSVTAQALDPIADPTVKTEADEGDIKINLGIPRVPKVEISETVDILEPGDVPTITDINESSDITLKFSLPRNQEIRVDETVEVLEPGEVPTITDVDEGEDIKLKFGIPRNQTIAIEPMTTIEPNEDALVENIGDEKDIRLKFSIPRNQEIKIHDTVDILEPGETPTITDVDEGKDITLKFGIPRNQTIAIESVTTLEPGKDAVVENVGDDKDIRLKFSIPRGVQGIQGKQGIQGIQGIPGNDGADGYTPVKGTDYFTDAEKEELFEETRVVAEEVVNEKAGVIQTTAEGESIQLTDSANEKLRGLKVFGKTNQMKTTGKNLLDLTSIIGKTASGNGGTLTCGKDGGITGSGTPTDSVSFHGIKLSIPTTESITLSASGNFKNMVCSYVLKRKDGSTKSFTVYDTRRAQTINLLDYPDLDYIAIEIKRNNNNIEMSGTAYFQVEMGTNATEYEPYSGGVASPSPGWEQPLDNVNAEISITDGYEQSSNFIVSNELAGIKVDSNGNYTDSNGQQWVCDEVDYARGKYVQRVATVTYDGSSDENHVLDSSGYFKVSIPTRAILKAEILCNKMIKQHMLHTTELGFFTNTNSRYLIFTGVYNQGIATTTDGLREWLSINPLTFMYILEEPIERDLTEEEIATYKTLQTYKPTTIISNNENAYMKVEYAADTKTYIDNKIEDKFTALQNAIVSLGGNV